MDSLISRSDQLLKEIADRLENPSKMFGSIGPKVPAKDIEKLNACIKNLKPYLHGAIFYRNIMSVIDNTPEDPQLTELESKLGPVGVSGGAAPYKNAKLNYLMNISMTIRTLLEPEKNVECASYVRLKNLIQGTMKSKGINISQLEDDIDRERAKTPPNFRDAEAILTPQRRMYDTSLITKLITQRAAQKTQAARAAFSKPLAVPGQSEADLEAEFNALPPTGGKTAKRKRKAKKVRKTRRV